MKIIVRKINKTDQWEGKKVYLPTDSGVYCITDNSAQCRGNIIPGLLKIINEEHSQDIIIESRGIFNIKKNNNETKCEIFLL